MSVWRKQTTKRGKGGCIYSKRYYGTLRLASGRSKQVPLTTDKASSKALLQRLQVEQDEYRCLGHSASYAEGRQRPLLELLDEYELFLHAKGDTEKHVVEQASRIRKLLTATKAKTLDDLNGGRILAALLNWRRTLKRFGIAASNAYLIAVKGFTRWLWQERKSPDDPLCGLRRMNAETDRRRLRRALTADEIRRLADVTQQSKRTYYGDGWRFTSSDRSMLYLTAAYTGLRAKELASLTKASFDFANGTLTLKASNTKNRKASTLPLYPELASRLQAWLKTLKRDTPWPGRWYDRGYAGRTLRRDLKRAGIVYVDDQGRYADFHALRYTFITALAKAGVHPSKAQRLARHSTVTLTMNVYTSLDVDDLRDAVERLPSFNSE